MFLQLYDKHFIEFEGTRLSAEEKRIGKHHVQVVHKSDKLGLAKLVVVIVSTSHLALNLYCHQGHTARNIDPPILC